MKGILPLFFLSVTLYLAEGNFYSRPQEHDQYHEFETHRFRDEWNSFHEPLTSELDQEMSIEGKVSSRTFQKPVWEKPEIISGRHDDDDKDAEDSGLRKSLPANEEVQVSVVGGSHSKSVTIFRNISEIPELLKSISEESKEEQEQCFVRPLIDLLHILIREVYDNPLSQQGDAPKGYQMLLKIVIALNQNIESVDGYDIMNKALLKLATVIRNLFRTFRHKFNGESESLEMKNALAMFSQLELVLYDFIDMSAADSSGTAHSIRLFLDYMESVLQELNDEANSSKNWEDHVSHIRRFLKDAQKTAIALCKESKDNNNKYIYIRRSSGLSYILTNIHNALKDLLADDTMFQNTSGSFDELLRLMLEGFERQLSEFLDEYVK